MSLTASASRQAAMPKGDSGDNPPISRQGRAVFSAYVVLTLHEKDDGLQIGAYDSETCKEQKLTLSFDELAQRLQDGAPLDGSDEEKREYFEQVYRHITFDLLEDGTRRMRLKTRKELSGGASAPAASEGSSSRLPSSSSGRKTTNRTSSRARTSGRPPSTNGTSRSKRGNQHSDMNGDDSARLSKTMNTRSASSTGRKAARRPKTSWTL